MPFKVDPETGRQLRGFAGMDVEKRREIARKGGASVASANRSFAKDRFLAASAGKKGGEASRGGGRPSGDIRDPIAQNPVPPAEAPVTEE